MAYECEILIPIGEFFSLGVRLTIEQVYMPLFCTNYGHSHVINYFLVCFNALIRQSLTYALALVAC